jgi:hypothetical protein
MPCRDDRLVEAIPPLAAAALAKISAITRLIVGMLILSALAEFERDPISFELGTGGSPTSSYRVLDPGSGR